jgi:hypothetical protein
MLGEKGADGLYALVGVRQVVKPEFEEVFSFRDFSLCMLQQLFYIGKAQGDADFWQSSSG